MSNHTMMIDSRRSGATHENAIKPLKPAVTIRNKSSHIMIELLQSSGDLNANILVVDRKHATLTITHASSIITQHSQERVDNG